MVKKKKNLYPASWGWNIISSIDDSRFSRCSYHFPPKPCFPNKPKHIVASAGICPEALSPRHRQPNKCSAATPANPRPNSHVPPSKSFAFWISSWPSNCDGTVRQFLEISRVWCFQHGFPKKTETIAMEILPFDTLFSGYTLWHAVSTHGQRFDLPSTFKSKAWAFKFYLCGPGVVWKQFSP